MKIKLERPFYLTFMNIQNFVDNIKKWEWGIISFHNANVFCLIPVCLLLCFILKLHFSSLKPEPEIVFPKDYKLLLKRISHTMLETHQSILTLYSFSSILYNALGLTHIKKFYQQLLYGQTTTKLMWTIYDSNSKIYLYLI